MSRMKRALAQVGKPFLLKRQFSAPRTVTPKEVLVLSIEGAQRLSQEKGKPAWFHHPDRDKLKHLFWLCEDGELVLIPPRF